jgi:hypothetical protein
MNAECTGSKLMTEREKRAFDFASDLTKQLITLSTSIVTVTFLFSKDSPGPKLLAVAIASAFTASISFQNGGQVDHATTSMAKGMWRSV